MLLCGRIVLVARFLPVFYPRILEFQDFAREVHTSEYLLAMDPLFPQLFTWRSVPLEKRTLRFDPSEARLSLLCIVFWSRVLTGC